MRFALVPLLALVAPPLATGAAPFHDTRAWCSNVILPQAGLLGHRPSTPGVELRGVDAQIRIVDGIATTTLTVSVGNRGATAAEAEILIPVPKAAVVRAFAFEGQPGTQSPSAEYDVLAKDSANATYQTIVAQLKDPALLEFAGSALIRSSVFPVEAGQTQAVRLTYEEVLASDGDRFDYVLPRTEFLGYAVPWSIGVEVESGPAIADVYSPSHGLTPGAQGPHRRSYTVATRPDGRLEAGPLRLSILHGDDTVATTLFTSRNPDGEGGWFLLLAGVGDLPPAEDAPPREVTIVIDRSGSMAGAKFDQAISAARQVLEGLEFGEAVQIIDYAATVERFAAQPVIKTKANLPALRAYLDGLLPNGGTNLDGALQLALQADVTDGFLPVVLFLTDGLATEGESREHVIRDRAIEANVHGRRVFTFGVGYDVNASLLDAVADRSRARATYVRPEEDVEVAVGAVFEDLAGPVLTDLEFAVTTSDGVADVRLLRDVYPGVMPDIYAGDRLLLVGRYTEAREGRLCLTGRAGARQVTHALDVDFGAAKTHNGFVPRLWAMRRIAALEDSIRQQGADPSALAALRDDPLFQETVAEMLHLASTHGILTDSTAFLAREGTALGSADELLVAACDMSYSNNDARSGTSGVAQQTNIGTNRAQGWVNCSNFLLDANGQAVANLGVQNIQGRTYFRRGQRWTEGRLAVTDAAVAEPQREILFGSPEYATLCTQLLASGRAAELTLRGEILLEWGGASILIKPQPLPPGAGYEAPMETPAHGTAGAAPGAPAGLQASARTPGQNRR